MTTQAGSVRRLLEAQKRIRLCTLPTPLQKPTGLQLLASSIELMIKRDDVMELALGGNKVRKLEFLMADAVARGSNVVITTGDLHSNHTRLTAAAARKLGMKTILAMKGKKPESINGNLLLDYLFGADVRFFDADRKELPAIMEEIRKERENKGERCYVIPRGGASAHGVLGYVNAVFELKKQLNGTNLDYIIFPTGTGATQAGIVLGAKLAGLGTKVVGISAGRNASEIGTDVERLVKETEGLLGVKTELSCEDIIVDDSYTCGGYAVVTKEVTDVVEMVAQREGLLVDPVYSGKGMLGLFGLTKNGYFPKGSRVLFIHTGGVPIIFSHWKPNPNSAQD